MKTSSSSSNSSLSDYGKGINGRNKISIDNKNNNNGRALPSIQNKEGGGS